MWYVLQVRAGTEENIRVQCRKNISEAVLKRCFIPYYEEKKRIRGLWTVQRRILFPGYVFVITDDPELLYQSLKRVVGLTKLIGTGDEIVPLEEEEQEFLLRMGGDDQIVRMSEGIIEQSRIIVTDGPLKGREGYIKKIDRHKRKAWLDVKLLGRVVTVQVGLEIVEKR